VGPRAGLDTEVRGKILCPCRGSNLDLPVVQSVARHYTDWATPAPIPRSKAWPGHDTNHSPPSSAKVKKDWELYLLPLILGCCLAVFGQLYFYFYKPHLVFLGQEFGFNNISSLSHSEFYLCESKVFMIAFTGLLLSLAALMIVCQWCRSLLTLGIDSAGYSHVTKICRYTGNMLVPFHVFNRCYSYTCTDSEFSLISLFEHSSTH
jgi:hypothetical protein